MSRVRSPRTSTRAIPGRFGSSPQARRSTQRPSRSDPRSTNRRSDSGSSKRRGGTTEQSAPALCVRLTRMRRDLRRTNG
jgi:hypothetical protein